MNTTENNKLIAEFMGYPLHKSIDTSQYLVKLNGRKFWQSMEFNSSWDWLMPVVEKIEATTLRLETDLTFGIEIHRNGCRVNRSWYTSDIPNFSWHQTGSKILSTYNAVISFINWYNETNK